MFRLLVMLLAILVAGTAFAQTPQAPPEKPKLGHSNNTELGIVVAAGNAKSTSVGLRDVYIYRWTNAEFGLEGGWLRATSRDGDRYAIEQGTGFEIAEPATAVDSHRLFSKLRYQRQMSPRLDWFSNFDAVRDEPANINRQFVLAAGLGTTWRKSEQLTFRTGYGISYTDEALVVEGANRFAGYRLQYGLKAALTSNTSMESELTGDGSFETGDDIRTDWLNAVSVAVNSRVALKAGIRMLFRNLPALETLSLETPNGINVGTVDVPKEKVDLNFTTSLVITF
jgi:putative salt-induced outer membrane protein YdiY